MAGGETTLTNNLSVPTIMVGGGAFTGVTVGNETPSALVPPTGTPLTGYPIDTGYYYVQGVHKWQAQAYSTAAVVPVTAAWGDNLTGDAKLSVGKPIRVELGLFDASGVSMDGYKVVKLEPDKLDRESKYGTLATGDASSGYSATPTSFVPVRVYDGKVTFSIKKVGTTTYPVPMGTTATAEINAGGAVVYGYNLRVTEAGQYEITYVTPSVTITGTNKPASTFTDTTVTLIITVTASGGGGGGGGKPR